MGEVYEVEHDLLGTRRALKVMARHFAGRADLAERLRVEARGLARLKHRNLVEVYDLGTAADGRIFFAMELLEGATLRELLRHQGRLGLAAALRVVTQILDGLAAAHTAGMIHRDVKPENVFVCGDGVAKLLDFGVAKAIDASTPAQSITGAGMTVGTPRYMSPEQAEGHPVDARTDVYSVGLLLWELLVGRPPFDDLDPMALTVLKMTEGVPSLETSGPTGLPLAVCGAVARACEASAELRFPTAEEFADALWAAVPSVPRARATASNVPVSSSQIENATTMLALASGFPPTDAASPPRSATDLDPAVRDRADPILALPEDEDQRERTERVEAVHSIDRDQPTFVAPAEPLMRGPTGTAMLPAVAARHRAQSEPPASLRAPVSPRARPAPDAATIVSRGASSRDFSRWKGLAAGVTAFVVPVSAALIVAYARFDLGAPPTGSDTAPVEASTSMASAAFSSVSEPLPAVSSSPSAEAPSAMGSATPPALSSAPPRAPTPPPTPAPPRSKEARPPAGPPTPATTRPGSMPASGL